jgi:hypothetical protein
VTYLGRTVRHAGEELGKVECGVGVMAYTEEQHLPVQVMDATDRAFSDMRRKWEWAGRDPSSFRSSAGKRVDVIASQYAGQAPEHVRNDSQAG